MTGDEKDDLSPPGRANIGADIHTALEQFALAPEVRESLRGLSESTAQAIGRLEGLRVPNTPTLEPIELRDPVDDQVAALNIALGDRLDRMLDTQLEQARTLAAYIKVFQVAHESDRALARGALILAIIGLGVSTIAAIGQIASLLRPPT